MTNQTNTLTMEHFANEKTLNIVKHALVLMTREGSVNQEYLKVAIDLSSCGDNDIKNARKVLIEQITFDSEDMDGSIYSSTAKATVSKIIKIAEFCKANPNEWKTIYDGLTTKGLQQAYLRINELIKAQKNNAANNEKTSEETSEETSKENTKNETIADENNDAIAVPSFMIILAHEMKTNETLFKALQALSQNPKLAENLISKPKKTVAKKTGTK